MNRNNRSAAQHAERTKWGRSKIGNGRYSAMAIAIPVGCLLGLAFALLAAWAGVTGPRALLGGAVFALCLAVPSIALIYALAVDRSTLLGAVARPEESIESQWYGAAAAGALTDVVLLAGIGAMLTTFLETDIDDNTLLGMVILVAALSCATRYVLARRRG